MPTAVLRRTQVVATFLSVIQLRLLGRCHLAAFVLLVQVPGLSPHAPLHLLKCGPGVRPVAVVPAPEQRQIALTLGLSVFLDDLSILRVEDMPRGCLPHTAARRALDARDQATGGAQGILLGRRGLEARRLAV